MSSLSWCYCSLQFVLAFNTITVRRAHPSRAMALTVIFSTMTFIAIAFDLLSSFSRLSEFNNLDLFFMLLCYLGIFASNTLAVRWANLSNFKAVTISLQAMRSLALAFFAWFKWCIWDSGIIHSFIRNFVVSRRRVFLRSHFGRLSLREHLRRNEWLRIYNWVRAIKRAIFYFLRWWIAKLIKKIGWLWIRAIDQQIVGILFAFPWGLKR